MSVRFGPACHRDPLDLPFSLFHVREQHVQIFAEFEVSRDLIRSLVDLRAAIKDAEIAPAPAKSEVEAEVAAIRKSIIEEMEARKAQFIEGLEVARLFGGLPVSVNAHLVHGHKGAIFVRHFFYLNGKLTPLNMILAIAEAYAAEKELSA